MLYELVYEEWLARKVSVEADSVDEAYEKLEKMVEEEKIVLGWEDFVECSIFEDGQTEF